MLSGDDIYIILCDFEFHVLKLLLFLLIQVSLFFYCVIKMSAFLPFIVAEHISGSALMY